MFELGGGVLFSFLGQEIWDGEGIDLHVLCVMNGVAERSLRMDGNDRGDGVDE